MARRMLPVAVLVVTAGFIFQPLSSVEASPDRYGSEAMAGVMSGAFFNCPDTALAYDAVGSTPSEIILAKGVFWDVAAMSRFFRPDAAALGLCAHGSTAEALRIGMDGISVVANPNESAACGGELAAGRSIDASSEIGTCPGCTGGQYLFADWKDVLRVLYAGYHHDGTFDCASAVRRVLANQWSGLFNATCSGGSCSHLQHVYRPGDLTGTSDDFLRFLNLPQMPLPHDIKAFPAGTIVLAGAIPATNPYCNAQAAGSVYGGAGDFLDLDPIRRQCAGDGLSSGEQVCEPDGTLGLVLPVAAPLGLGSNPYAAELCDPGKFRLLSVGTPDISRCPNGKPLLFGKCFQGIKETGGGGFTAHCLVGKTFRYFGSAGTDPRATNLVAKTTAGAYARDSIGRLVTAAFYRVHSTATLAGTPCRQRSTLQIGCLTQASPCSIGVAARESWNGTGAAPLALGGVLPTQEKIQNFDATPNDPSDDYPMSRYLYLTTAVGFESSNNGVDDKLARCLSKPDFIGPLMVQHNYVAVPQVTCADFDESAACPNTPVNVNACANNPAGIPGTSP